MVQGSPLCETHDCVKNITWAEEHFVKLLSLNTVRLQMIAFWFYTASHLFRSPGCTSQSLFAKHIDTSTWKFQYCQYVDCAIKIQKDEFLHLVLQAW